MRDLVRVLKAMADPMRLRLLKMLEKKRMCVCELTAALDIQQSSVSHHLRILKDAGLVDDVRNGPWVDYVRAGKAYNQFAPELLERLSRWLNDDPEVMADAKKAGRADRKKLCAG